MGHEVMAAEIFAEIVGARGLDEVPETTFASVRALKPEERRAVAAALEGLLVAALHKTAWREQQNPMRGLGEMERRAIEAGKANLAIMRGMHGALDLVSFARGADAQPMTRAYLAELSGIDAPKVQDYVEAACRAFSRVAAETPDPS